MTVQAVTFDVGGTLISVWPSVGEVYADVAANHGLPGLNPGELARRFGAAWSRRANFGYRRHEWEAIVDEIFAGLAPERPSRTFFDALYRRFDEPECWRIHSDVVEVLEALRERGVRLGLISNWDDRLRPLLTRLDLARWFEVIVISCEAGWVKPDRRIFETAAHAFWLQPGAILHVGDCLSEDVAGARAAGFRALLLDRAGQVAQPGVILHLSSVTEHLR